MIFDISIRANDGDDGVLSVSDNLMKGISVAWQNLDVETLTITIAIQNNGIEIKAVSSSNKVILTVSPENLKELTYINFTHLDLIGFYLLKVFYLRTF